MCSKIEAGAPRTSHYTPEEDADWEHFVCEDCGAVYKLPWNADRDTQLPMCNHGGNYAWPFERDVATMEKYGWIKMKLADVRARD